LPGWKNISEKWQDISFTAQKSANNTCVEISAFATNKPAVNSWLIMPPVNLSNSANEILSFQTKDGFDNGAVFQVFVSTNYDGGNTPWKAKWTASQTQYRKRGCFFCEERLGSSGNISLSGFPGNVHVAFRYDGADPANPY
jgi:hypothetical protein